MQRPYVPSAYADHSSVYSKSRVQSVFDPRVSTVSYRPGVDDSHEPNDTEFEEDVSDLEEYSGRRSEDSVGKRSATTLSSFDELRTPDTRSNDFSGFNFQLDGSIPIKSVEGPTGPHLFRSSTGSARELDTFLTMSPPVSPEEARAAPQSAKPAERRAPPADANPPRTSIPLRTWTPRQVAEWMYSIGFERHIVDTFFINDISGVTLIDLQYDDLKELGISSFGQRHRLWNEIRTLKEQKLAGPEDELLFSPGVPPTPAAAPLTPAGGEAYPEVPKKCAAPDSADEEAVVSPTSGRRRRRRRHTDNDVISPAESASIVAIEQLLPRPHVCARGEACPKWQRRQRKLARIATDFPAEMAQILDAEAKSSPTESGVAATALSLVVPSVVASSDVLGHAQPAIRLDEERLRGVASRDPQENVRAFLEFQHMGTNKEAVSPPKPQEPHANLRNLPRLTIPMVQQTDAAKADPASATHNSRTARPSRRLASPLQGFRLAPPPPPQDMWRVASPASEMDVPVTAIPLGPVERDFSSSVPPDMRYGAHQQLAQQQPPHPYHYYPQQQQQQQQQPPLSRSTSTRGAPRAGGPPLSFHLPHAPQTLASPVSRPRSAGAHRRQPSLTVAPAAVAEAADEDQAAAVLSPQCNSPDSPDGQSASPTEIDADDDDGDLTPTAARPDGSNHEGWMKKRRTRMLRHEWQEAHFRLRGTQLAMHADARALDAIEYIDVDDYAVAISANASRLNSAFRRLHLAPARAKGLDPHAFAFQLTPAAERRGVRHAATGKTHHFAVRTANERIDWMRELMLARARREKDVAIASFQ